MPKLKLENLYSHKFVIIGLKLRTKNRKCGIWFLSNNRKMKYKCLYLVDCKLVLIEKRRRYSSGVALTFLKVQIQNC